MSLNFLVDGTKSEMLQKLKAKGFTSSPYDNEILEGEFNGEKVRIHIVTNGNKVYRIMIVDQTERDETSIKIRFNKLCQQFENNSKYISFKENQSISEDEDVDYNILVHKKRYEAVYYQQPEATDTTAIRQELTNLYLSKYTQEQLENPTSAIQADCENMTMDYFYNIFSKKSVWFMISEDSYNKYYILMYYDNEYNRANGEDL